MSTGSAIIAVLATAATIGVAQVVANFYLKRMEIRSGVAERRIMVEGSRRRGSTPGSRDELELLQQLILQQDRVLKRIDEEPKTVVVNVAAPSGTLPDRSRLGAPQLEQSRAGNLTIVQELSHNLRTPLSQIEATVLTLMSADTVERSSIQTSLGRIQDNVDICKV